MSQVTFETYGAHTRSGPNHSIADDNWAQLQSYLTNVRDTVDAVRRSQGIEEDPPTIRRDNRFMPHGWVGSYPGGVDVVPDKVSEETYNRFLTESRGFIESIGLNTAEAVLPFAPDVLEDARALYLRYSESCLELTEPLLAARLPITVEPETYVGHELRGTPDFATTVVKRSQGRRVTASTSVHFSIETLGTRLLYQFNYVLRERLRDLRDTFDIDTPQVRQRIAYHDGVCRERLPAQLTRQPATELFLDADEIATLQDEATDQIADLANLWAAYKQRLSTELDPSKRYDAAIKPASKVFELWCLVQILNALRGRFGQETRPDAGTTFPKRFIFDDRITLHYDRSKTSDSRYIKPLLRPAPNRRAGAPDFMIEIDGDIRWIADAKFQNATDIDLGGAQRFLSYVTDYLPDTGGASTLFCIGSTTTDGKIAGTSFTKIGALDTSTEADHQPFRTVVEEVLS
ncbi:hypothetical protein C464_11975 [Halorubrum coriense DSM 10284]|uniref:Uncharacterized protein n=1 Tax=Halorubrum coriense DSM 10284 TaxID=1227466 RepID=M0ED07_9EURY|nr:hypothetical protein [Halorubrum coriense]ELZ45635.1 hypothetical protein C464_11975 [Halorubrum coriense DSM 10284]